MCAMYEIGMQALTHQCCTWLTVNLQSWYGTAYVLMGNGVY
jgi:hypothetical protein